MKTKSNQYVKIKNSKIHGSGGFAKKNIKKGTKIIEYVGNILTKKDAEKIPDEEGVFLFELNKKCDIDGNVPWNPARFINHSCSPNCKTENKKNRIWIIAKKDIKKGEELSYDYGFSLDCHKEYACKCGAKNCVGYIVDREHWKKVKKKWTIEDLAKKDEFYTKRWKEHYTDKEYFKLNQELRKHLNKLIRKNKIKKGRDYYTAGIILHHSNNVHLLKKALKYAEASYKKGYKQGKTLYAQITDRLLKLLGKPQKFGTQVIDENAKILKIYPLDGTVTDKMRKEHGLPTLKFLKEYLNKK